MKSRKDKYTIIIPVSMNVHLAGIVDVWAKEKDQNRSEFVRNAIRYYIRKLINEEADGH